MRLASGTRFRVLTVVLGAQQACVAALEKANRDLGWQVSMLARGGSAGPTPPHRGPPESPGPASEGAGALEPSHTQPKTYQLGSVTHCTDASRPALLPRVCPSRRGARPV